jgi:hypothetical protein
MWIWESMTREVEAQGEYGPLTSHDYRDETRLSGPLGAVGVSFSAFEKIPVTSRLSAGLAWLSSRTSNSGTYAGSAPDGSGQTTPFAVPASIPELDETLATPFLSAEIRVGYRFLPHILADLGLGLSVFFPPPVPRTGATSFSNDGTRVTQLPSSGIPEGVNPGTLTLPKENVAGTFLAFAPTLGARLTF